MLKKYKVSLKITGPVLDESLSVLKKLSELKSIKLFEIALYNDNLLLKKSKRRIDHVYGSIKERYLSEFGDEEYTDLPLLKILNHTTKEESYLLLYYYLAISDNLLYDFVIEIVYQRYIKGFLGVSKEDSYGFLLEATKTHNEMSCWSERTFKDLTSALITVLLEVGFIKNRRSPEFIDKYLPLSVFGYVLYLNKNEILTLDDLYKNKNFKLLLQDKAQRKFLIKELNNLGYIEVHHDTDSAILYKFNTVEEFVNEYVSRKN